ncbi:MAG: hypothetical protein ABDH21_05965 [bacterium]
MKVGIVSNSPGEVLGWAVPASSILKKLGFTIDLYLTPCMFATNKEYEVALQHGHFDKIYKPKQTLFEILLPQKRYDLFFHMGGDIWYSTKFKTSKLYSYGWGTKRLDKFFCLYLVPNQYYYRKLTERGIPSSKIVKIKDLAFEKLKRKQYDPNSKLIGFMLGSREVEFWNLLEIYLQTIALMPKDYEYIFFVSPFIYQDDSFEQKLQGIMKMYEGYRVKFLVNEVEKYEVMSKLRLMVTIPGTKTNEAGFLGIPQLVILPLQKPEHIPVWGIVGWLDFLGSFGKKIKSYFVIKYAEKNLLNKKRYIAMPNMVSNSEIVPEMIDKITPEKLCQVLLSMVENSELLSRISNDLVRVYDEWEYEAISFHDFVRRI